jgi:hypothetical protein
MLFSAGAVAGVHLASPPQHTTSSALAGSAANAAVSAQTFDLDSSSAANNPTASNSGADGGVSGWQSSSGTMNALLSMQGRLGSGQATFVPGDPGTQGGAPHPRHPSGGTDPLPLLPLLPGSGIRPGGPEPLPLLPLLPGPGIQPRTTIPEMK